MAFLKTIKFIISHPLNHDKTLSGYFVLYDGSLGVE